METMEFAERLKYLSIPKSSHSVRPMALQRRSFASIFNGLKAYTDSWRGTPYLIKCLVRFLWVTVRGSSVGIMTRI